MKLPKLPLLATLAAVGALFVLRKKDEAKTPPGGTAPGGTVPGGTAPLPVGVYILARDALLYTDTAAPGAASTVVARLQAGDRVVQIGPPSGGYAHVRAGLGKQGWVDRRALGVIRWT